MNQKPKTIRFADEKNNKSKHNYDKESEKEIETERDIAKVKPTSLQQKMLAMAGQDIDQFMREMEVVHKKRETERAQDLSARLCLLKSDSKSGSEKLNGKGFVKNTDEDIELPSRGDHTSGANQHGMLQQTAIPLMGLPPPSLLFRPPPPPMHLRMPPPPPPRLGLRLPPGTYEENFYF